MGQGTCVVAAGDDQKLLYSLGARTMVQLAEKFTEATLFLPFGEAHAWL